MPSTIFNGPRVKALKDIFSVNGKFELITGLTIDPTDVATDGEPGYLLIKEDDGVIYRKLDTGVTTNWEILGSGATGSKNYIELKNSDFEVGANDWTTDDGTGAVSSVISLATTDVVGEVLSGKTSLKLTKTAADATGHFFKIASLEIDPSDRGRVLYGSFPFRPLAGYVSEDLIVEVFDVTNSVVLFSGAADVNEIVNLKGIVPFYARTDETTEQVELRIKINNSNLNAYDAVIDEVVFGPQAIVAGTDILSINELHYRTLNVKAEGNSGASITANVTDIDWTETVDTLSNWDGTTFTAPFTGRFVITGRAHFTTVGDASIQMIINGVANKFIGGDNSRVIYINTEVELNEGDQLTFRTNQSRILVNDPNLHWLSITPITDLTTVGVARDVVDTYQKKVMTTINTPADLDFTGLEAGKTYRLTVVARFNAAAAADIILQATGPDGLIFETLGNEMSLGAGVAARITSGQTDMFTLANSGDINFATTLNTADIQAGSYAILETFNNVVISTAN